MNNKISGKEYPIIKIFSSDFEYHIPSYQRPYAWDIEETSALFDDLLDFYQTEESDNYFLGSIVLIKDELIRYAEVIDGQQRLTTLSILFAALASCYNSPELRANCIKYLQDEGDPIADTPAQPRLFLRDWDQPFFNKYIQNVKLDDLSAIDPATLDTESKNHIRTNAILLQKCIRENFTGDDELIKFNRFILNRCFLVAVSTPSQESAFRVFSVMNSRGLDLLPTDIIKSETIGKLPNTEMKKYTEIWEELENMTGRDGFNEVFTHTRTIFAKEKAKKNLLDEFKEFVIKSTTPRELIDNYLVPYTNAYVQLKNCEYMSSQYAEEINESLFWLNKTNNYDWMPSAIKFFAEHQNDSAYIRWFIKKLERLASFLLVTSMDVNHRMDRYKWILVEMETNPQHSLQRPLKNIELTEWEKETFLKTLNGEIYTMVPQRRNYIIQRLDSFVSDGGASYNAKLFTIEHVLPQNPSKGSEWFSLWPDANVRDYWLNRVANLVPLTRQRNSAAQNYDFATKKSKYFQTKNGTSSYTLTTQVLNYSQWTPELVKERQENLLEVFSKNWDLSPLPDADDSNMTFMLAGRGGNAEGYPLGNDRFLVKKGSVISKDKTEGFRQGYAELRDRLINEGVIINNTFVMDYEFSSVSAAAAVVLGRAANGRKEWMRLDGITVAQSGH